MTPLRAVRLKREMLQADVAEEAGVCQQAYSHYERGLRVPTVTIALRIARVLGIKASEFEEVFGE